MIRIDEMKQQKSLGTLREDLQISGMKTEVAGYIPKGESVDVGITGLKSEIKLTGDGRVHVTLGGMKSKAVLAPSLDATIDQIGMKSTAVRRSVDAITAPADQKTSSSATNSQSLECPVCHVSYNPTQRGPICPNGHPYQVEFDEDDDRLDTQAWVDDDESRETDSDGLDTRIWSDET